MSWQCMYELTMQAEARYRSVLNDMDTGGILSSMGLHRLQTYLHMQCSDGISNVGNSANGRSAKMSVLKMLQTRLASIETRQIKVLVTGMYNAGKSSFLNILMGGNYLPVDRGKVTKVVCEIRNGTYRVAELHFKDRQIKRLLLSVDANENNWKEVQKNIKGHGDKELNRIVIHWPLPVSAGMFDDLKEGRYSISKPKSEAMPIQQKQNDPAYSDVDVPDISSADSGFLTVTGQDDTDRKLYDSSGDPYIHFPEVSPGFVIVDARGTGTANRTLERQQPNVDSENTDPKRLYHKQNSVSSSSTSTSKSTDDSESEVEKAEVLDVQPESTEKLNNVAVFPIIFVDCPGIDEEDQDTSFATVLDEVCDCNSFIFIIDTIRDDGIKQQGLLALLQRMKEKLAENGLTFNTDSAIFIANKIDDSDRERIRQEELEKLQETLPTVTENNVITMTAVRVLKKMAKGKHQPRDNVYGEIRNCLRDAYRLSLEDHILWMLKLIDAARSISQLGKGSNVIKTSQDLKDCRTRAVSLQTIDTEKVDKEKALIKETTKYFQDMLRDGENDIKKIDWKECLGKQMETASVKYKDNDRKKENIFRKLHDIIYAEILKIPLINDELKEMKERYEQDRNAIYVDEIRHLEKLTEHLNGLQGRNESNGDGIVGRLVNIIGFGAIIALAPVMPIVWLLKSVIVDERDEYIYNRELAKFKEMPELYIKQKVEMMLMKETSELPMFLDDIGNTKRKEIHEQSQNIINDIDYLLGSQTQVTEANERTIEQHFTHTRRLYLQCFTAISNNDYTEVAPDETVSVGSVRNSSEDDADNSYRKMWIRDWNDIHATWNDICLKRQPETHDGDLTVHECVLLRQMSRNTIDRMAQTLETRLIIGREFEVCRFVLESSGYDLDWVISNEASQQRDEFLHYAYECCKCVEVLHNWNMVHGDIKPAQFLLTGPFIDGYWHSVRISVTAHQEEDQKQEYLDDGARVSRLNVTSSSDVYSLSLILLQLWFRKELRSIRRGIENKFRMPEDKFVGPQLFMGLAGDRTKRANVKNILCQIEKIKRAIIEKNKHTTTSELTT